MFHIAVIAGFLAMSLNAFSQATQPGYVSATIVTPISLAKVDDLDFGNISVNTDGGSVTLLPTSTPARTISGGVTLPSTQGTVQAGSFTVTGAPGFTFTISLPSSHSIIRNNGIEMMLVDEFSCNPSPAGSLNESGICDLLIGATVHVAAAQTPGIYLSAAPFDITVNYQ